MTDGKDYEVGYGKPPTRTRFQKGRSGNPRGRPKGARNLETDLAEELGERIRIREDGRDRRVSKQKAMIKALVAKALKGDTRAALALFALAPKPAKGSTEEPTGLDELDRWILEDLERRLTEPSEADERIEP